MAQYVAVCTASPHRRFRRCRFGQNGRNTPISTNGPCLWFIARGRTVAVTTNGPWRKSARSFFVTEKEVLCLPNWRRNARVRVETMANGVDSGVFRAFRNLCSPYQAGDIPVVFHRRHGLPAEYRCCPVVRQVRVARASRQPAANRFSSSAGTRLPELQALVSDRVGHGNVPTFAPIFQHAWPRLALLRVAWGIQNKIGSHGYMAAGHRLDSLCRRWDAAPERIFAAESVQASRQVAVDKRPCRRRRRLKASGVAPARPWSIASSWGRQYGHCDATSNSGAAPV